MITNKNAAYIFLFNTRADTRVAETARRLAENCDV